MFRIELEDLASNAFITLMRAKKLNRQRFISYADIDKYANGVLNALKEKDLSGRLDLGRNQTSWFLYYENKYFVEDYSGDMCGLRLNANITEKDLIDRYVGCLPLDLLLAFRSNTAIKELVA